ncbi:MAG: aldo/keto reductase [Candidatus Scalindua sp. AMX11]|nr:MAG: aldo/keto reductase [Candidatus Scalindua sp.]NOG83624.1 aldo/keto reductase [Planctomycetota bacterium]RZV69624.1 MAG: aldo/keto reductase [Candidatus Scalindua sp. SCAELEC01]TDE64112.1 MAG: aldo/keto reductase [Candidatus Scalindua sp. AMX11]
MEYRVLGKSDLSVSIIGYGAWGIGGAPFWTTEGEENSANSILKALSVGINFFDTAPVYGFGYSEELLGKTLRKKREDVIIATKCGLRWEREDLSSLRKEATQKSILFEIDASLKRLQTDYVDLYQVHWPDESTPISETMEALLKIQKAGKARYIGVSNYTVEMMKESLTYGQIVSLQPMYSMLERDIEQTILPYCREVDIGIICYSPLASGVLTGKYDENTKFKDWRGKDIIGHFTDDVYLSHVRKVKEIAKIAKKLGKTTAQLAINWLIHQSGVTTALVGVKNPGQVEQNSGAVGWKIPDEDLNTIINILEERRL